MSSVLVKMCGFMREEDVESAIKQDVNILGFVVEYPLPVPWNMKLERAEKLVAHFRKASASSPTKCSVVTGGPVDKILSIDKALSPDYLQLHFKETADDIRALKKAGVKAKIIKTVPLNSKDRVFQSGEEDIGKCASIFEEAGADIVLVDARGPENAASSVSLIDVELYKAVKSAVSIPVMAAGGITPDNVRNIIEELKPDMIDMMTGIEISPGIKSEESITSIMKGVRYE